MSDNESSSQDPLAATLRSQYQGPMESEELQFTDDASVVEMRLSMVTTYGCTDLQPIATKDEGPEPA